MSSSLPSGDTSSSSASIDLGSNTTGPSSGETSVPLENEYRELEERLGYTFRDKGWLIRAFTHRSAHAGQSTCDYERLEFVGDAVFDLAVAHLLSIKHESATEGELSKMRAALVKASSLANIAQRLSLSRFIRVSRSELANGANHRPSILADVLEAIIGAVFLEAGFEAARECVAQLLGDDILTVVPRDPKTELQELLHAAGGRAPTYRIEHTDGPEHSPVFISTVEIDGRIIGRGRGSTKKASQQAAAEEALRTGPFSQRYLSTESQSESNVSVVADELLGEVGGIDHD
jgi:ribonuclease-3